MPNARKTINSNVVGVAVAEELEPKVLPATTVWHDRSVNSYSDFGSDITMTAEETINASRQDERGSVVDLDADGGYSINMKNGLTRDMQGFFFADAYEKVDTAPLNGTAVTLTSVATAGAYNAASGLGNFKVGMLVATTGFVVPTNNGLGVVTAATTTKTTTDITTVAESTPTTGRLKQVGLEFATGDLAMTVAGGLVTLSSTANSWANLDVKVGETIFIGGDTVATRYGSGYGYGRVASVTNGAVALDDVSWISTPTAGVAIGADTGTGKKIRVFAGTFIRNEDDPALIKCRTYQVERTLGNDDNGVQSEYLTGAVKNELALNIPLTELHTADFTYMALDNEQRTGAEGRKAGAHIAAPSQKPYNTSSHVFVMKMNILDKTTLQPTGLFGYASDASFSVANGASATKAIGVLGGFDITVGNFKVGGSITAYFTTVESVKAIRQNKDVGFMAILAAGNKGLVYDVPYAGASGGRLQVEKDAPITLPVETTGARNENGYTMSYTSFDYLPNVAMPV